jgi:hypothetical protein
MPQTEKPAIKMRNDLSLEGIVAGRSKAEHNLVSLGFLGSSREVPGNAGISPKTRLILTRHNMTRAS